MKTRWVIYYPNILTPSSTSNRIHAIYHDVQSSNHWEFSYIDFNITFIVYFMFLEINLNLTFLWKKFPIL